MEKLFRFAGERSGWTFDMLEGMQQRVMKEARFVAVKRRDIRIPIGDLPEDSKQKQIRLICVEATLGGY